MNSLKFFDHEVRFSIRFSRRSFQNEETSYEEEEFDLDEGEESPDDEDPFNDIIF